MPESLNKKILSHLSDDRLEEALELFGDTHLASDAILLQRRLKQIKKDNLNNTISYEEYSRGISQIGTGISELVYKLLPGSSDTFTKNQIKLESTSTFLEGLQNNFGKYFLKIESKANPQDIFRTLSGGKENAPLYSRIHNIDVDNENRHLKIYYGHLNGEADGFYSDNGFFEGNFKTKAGTGTFQMNFNKDGTAKGRWKSYFSIIFSGEFSIVKEIGG